mmetsp:Transcript_11159/g.16460  ORF Transcript_11159/g.16460 Transcript_11159/m.16460 type:complete len:205 (+) Transcript_11159:61-675(+)
MALPPTLDQPLIWLSALQRAVCQKHAALREYVPLLPCWVPQRRIAEALGHSSQGIETALESLGGQPYVWATEFENVHTTWRYDEPALHIDGERYPCSEDYFHAQKPKPFDKSLWDGALRVAVMRKGVRAKFEADTALQDLLRATHPHPLLSLKGDTFWGFDPKWGGENMLARLIMELRDELVGQPAEARQRWWWWWWCGKKSAH